MSERIVSVFGTGRAREGEPAYDMARKLGRMLAEARFTIANGGYGGTMLATAKGAAEAGGTVIGVTCKAFENSTANQYVTREVVTESLTDRLHNLVKAGDAYIVLPGGTGTLLELASVWELKNKRFLDRTKPIVLIGDFWKPLVDLVSLHDSDATSYVALAAGPAQAVKLIEKALG